MKKHNPTSIFIAYSHLDKNHLQALRIQLKPLELNGKIKVWYDGEILPGEVWDNRIKKSLHNADIILLLVSPNSLASEYFYEKEVSDALKRHHNNEARVIPVILSYCQWDETPLAEIQGLPPGALPIVKWSDNSEAWHAVVKGIRKTIKELEQVHIQLAKEQRILIEKESKSSRFQETFLQAENKFDNKIWKEALALFDDLITQYEDGLKPKKEILIKRISECKKEIKSEEQKAKAAIEKSNYQKRYKLFQQTIDIANNQFEQQKWSEATTLYKKAKAQLEVGYSPDLSFIEQQLSACRLSIKKFKKIDANEEAVQNFHNRKRIFESNYQKAIDYFQKNQWNKAKSFLEKAIDLHEPGFQPAKTDIIELMSKCIKEMAYEQYNKNAIMPFNIKRLLAGTILGGIAYFLLSWLVWGIILKVTLSIPEETGKLIFRVPMGMVAMFISCVALAALITYIYMHWAKISTFATGAKGGAIIGALTSLWMDLSYFSQYNFFEMKNVIIDVIAVAVVIAIVGGLIGVLLGKMNKE